MSSFAIRALRLKYAVQTLGRAKKPRIFVNSIPKSGTNLIVSLAKAYGRLRVSGPFIAPHMQATHLARAGGLVFGHIEIVTGRITECGFEDGILLMRRPEAYAASLGRYIDVNPRHPLHAQLAGATPAVLLASVIEGIEAGLFHLPPLHERYAAYLDNATEAGLRVADYDRLLNAPATGTAEADLLAHLGGPDYAASFDTVLAMSRKISSTWRHSARATRDFSLPDPLAAHPNLREATALYEAALRR